jgi:bifunctional non-homologous end joining protein LigD
VAQLSERLYPDRVVSDMKKSLRSNRVFVDWSQNDDYKTTVCVYSLRAKERPTVSTPVRWEEVESCLKKEDPELLVLVADEVLKRVDKMGDLFEAVLKLKQKLPEINALEKLGAAPVSAAEHKTHEVAPKTKPRKTSREFARKNAK